MVSAKVTYQFLGRLVVSVHLLYYCRQLGDLLLKVRDDVGPVGQTPPSPPESVIQLFTPAAPGRLLAAMAWDVLFGVVPNKTSHRRVAGPRAWPFG